MKKNIVFYCHNFWWLGHLRRISLIIKEILDNFSSYYNVILLNSWKEEDFLFNFDNKNWLKIINLPNYEIKNYKIINWEKIYKYRKTIYHRLFSLWNIEKLVIEHYPFGRNFLDEEIKFLIEEFKKFNKKWIAFSSVRDIFDIKAVNVNNLNLFDRFLIHGDKNIINYDDFFEEKINNRIIYTWYVIDSIQTTIKEEDYVLISLWWWQDWFEYIIDFLNKFKKLNLKLKVFINLWLNYTKENLSKLEEIGLKNIEVKKYFDNFLEIKNNAKLVVSMWWYNNLVENVYYNKKSIIYPRKTDEEQQIRLKIFKQLFKNIFDWNDLDTSDIKVILEQNMTENSNEISFNWAYFSALFLCNYSKYKYIKIRLTNICNAKCDMCWVIKRYPKSNNVWNIEKTILDFYKLWGEIINFTWWEPTIYPHFWDLLYLCKTLWLTTSVSTNGSTLWTSFFEKLHKNWVRLIDYIDISVDGLYNLQDKRRNYKWLFSIIENNLQKLIDSWIKIHINITIRKDNIHEAREIFDYFKSKNVDSISFWMVASAPWNDMEYMLPDLEKTENFYSLEKDYIINNAWDIKVDFSWNLTKDFILNQEWLKCKYINSKQEIRINEDWNIVPCCILDDYYIWLGNINKDWLLEILCSRVYENFLNKNIGDISSICLSCKIYNNTKI
jgi:predicted glycosyltransferase/MoaA/NifB/PqqE/SkfB family radical SAM enzyme